MANDQLTPPGELVKRVTPTEVRDCLQVVHPFKTVQVRGTVIELRPWPQRNPRFVYGKLRDFGVEDGAIIDFRCPIESGPQMLHQLVEITGTLYPEVGADQISVLIRGHCQPIEPQDQDIVAAAGLVPRRAERLRLSNLVEEREVRSIAVIGTAAAHADIVTALEHPDAKDRLPLYPVSTARVDELIVQLQQVKADDIDACVLAHDGLGAIIGSWYSERLVRTIEALGIPVYTALGYAGAITPADQHADEAFESPAEFGAALKTAIERIVHHQELVLTRDEALAMHQKSLAEIHATQDAFDRKLRFAQQTARRRTRKAAIIGAALGALLAAAVAWGLQQEWAKQWLQQLG